MILIALYKVTSPNADLFDKLVSFGTRSIYTHAEILHIDDYHCNQISVSPRDGSLRSKPHLIDHLSWDYFYIEDLIEDSVLQYCELKMGTKYDWLALTGFITRLKINAANRLFCSEFVTEAIRYGGVDLFRHSKPFMVSPAMLGDNMLLKQVHTLERNAFTGYMSIGK